jgi:hypothetical protein
MPQVMQGLSRVTAHMQGLSPSWVWVPCPSAAGCIHAPIPSTVSDPSAMHAAKMREDNPARNGRVRS